MNLIKKLFNKKTNSEPEIEPEIKVEKVEYVSEWVEFKNQKPPHEVVLGACDTYDCGWTMDTVW